LAIYVDQTVKIKFMGGREGKLSRPEGQKADEQ
jgi:hypothetical protein